jgi:hypothetical protein
MLRRDAKGKIAFEIGSPKQLAGGLFISTPIQPASA